MAYPQTIDTFDTAMQGTTLVATDDHALNHRVAGSNLGGIVQTLGTTPAGTLFSSFAVADKPVRHQGGTFQQVMIGTVNLSAGTITGGITNNGTIIGGTFAGTITNNALVNNGTYSNPIVNNGTFGTITAPANEDLVLSAGSAVLGPMQRQGGTSNSFPVYGTTNFIESNVFMQMGCRQITGTATGIEIIFPVSFSEPPLVLATQVSNLTVRGGVVGTIGTNGCSVICYEFLGTTDFFNWLAIGKR